MDNNKYLFLITGAAGSGKSTLAQKIQEVGSKYIAPIAEICEADEFWYILGKGKYAFDPKLLWKAHKWCQDNAREVMSNGENLMFIHLRTQFQNQHGVPEKAVANMRNNYVPPTGWELERILKWDDMTDDLKELLKDVEVDYEY